eukprot:CAMPEP_0181532948 /NCGR_PEP_ID=MMETSP1110-20121109/72890_1 /TAXON_ID=174948 /ORGANISM="Symbiodinium sp., Strain CCMP421" /LENGTH=37 /DNA_ID= /DNA_START= /DNA_END= /DNA_ORIENTATION=
MQENQAAVVDPHSAHACGMSAGMLLVLLPLELMHRHD